MVKLSHFDWLFLQTVALQSAQIKTTLFRSEEEVVDKKSSVELFVQYI